MSDVLDKIRGSLIGGAAGDALGYAVEFNDEGTIFGRYGAGGIRSYSLEEGKARVSDDTQMTLFTAYAMICCAEERKEKGSAAAPRYYAAEAYLEWLMTQDSSYGTACGNYGNFEDPRETDGLIAVPLLRLPEIYAWRAPGNTCLSSLRTRRAQDHRIDSYIKDPVNPSKGCGGVMRAAPVGMIPWESIEEMDRESAEIAAITHGHSLGYLPAAVLTHVVHRLIFCPEQMTLRQIVEEARDTVTGIFAEDEHAGELARLINKAIALSESGGDDLDNIHALGEGWVGDQALAIALYCSLKYKEDFSEGLIASVNHMGDSDSTGAVTGNILGALVGYEALDQKWKDDLELREEILKTADRLYEAACL